MSTSLAETINDMCAPPDRSLFSKRSREELAAIVKDAAWTGGNVRLVRSQSNFHYVGYFIVFDSEQDLLQFSLRFGHKL